MSTNGMKKNLLAISDPRQRAQQLSRLVAEQQALLADLAQLRRETVAELRAGGLSARYGSAGRLMFGLENDWVWLSF